MSPNVVHVLQYDVNGSRFQIYKLGRRTAAIDENGGSLTGYLWSYVRSMLLFDLPRKFSDEDVVDPGSVDNLEVCHLLGLR